MRIAAGHEIAAKHSIHMVQYVAVECRSHAERIIVGRVEPRLVLYRVDADQESAAGNFAMSLDRLQET